MIATVVLACAHTPRPTARDVQTVVAAFDECAKGVPWPRTESERFVVVDLIETAKKAPVLKVAFGCLPCAQRVFGRSFEEPMVPDATVPEVLVA